jgi:hypothetical protein
MVVWRDFWGPMRGCFSCKREWDCGSMLRWRGSGMTCAFRRGYARLSSSPRMVAFLYDTLQRILHEDVAGEG